MSDFAMPVFEQIEKRSRMMHLAYLDPHAVPANSPKAMQITQTVASLARVGARRGWQVSLVTPQAALPAEVILGQAWPNELAVHHLPMHHWWYPFPRSCRPFYWAAVQWCRQHRPDVVFVRNLKLADALLRAKLGIPVVFETHEWFTQTYREEHPKPSYKQARKLAQLEEREQRVYRGAAGVVTLTHALWRDIQGAYALTHRPCVAADAVELSFAQALPVVSLTQPPVIAYLGSLHPWKGVETLVAAMAYIPAPTRLRLIGGTPERIASLKALAERLGVADRIDCRGYISPEHRFAALNDVSICLLPSSATSIGAKYTSPLKLFEYMALAKPCVVANLPAMREIVVHGETAWLVPVADASALAAGVNHLLANPQLAKALGEAAAAVVEASYTWAARAENLLDYIESLSFVEWR